jgi:hypothetical protein
MPLLPPTHLPTACSVDLNRGRGHNVAHPPPISSGICSKCAWYAPSADHTATDYRYEGDDKLLDDDDRGVMMEWERPLMKAHAGVICQTQGDVLNVGFGMGIIDGMIQEHSPRSHTIIEAHPAVHARMVADGWDKKEGVTVIFGRWEDVVGGLDRQFDGIFFDTFVCYPLSLSKTTPSVVVPPLSASEKCTLSGSPSLKL